MTTQLNEQDIVEILSQLMCNFADLCINDKEIARLRSAICDAHGGSITKHSTKRLLDRYFPDRNYFRNHPDKNRRRDLTVLFKSCYVLICFYQQQYDALKYRSIEELKQHYPQFTERNLFDDELELLLRFRNLMRIALEVIDAHGNKHMLLKIAGRLEGSQREYITGGGQTLAVKCRVEIYEQEGAVQPRKRPPRIAVPFVSLSNIDAAQNSSAVMENDSVCGKRKASALADEPRCGGRMKLETGPVDQHLSSCATAVTSEASKGIKLLPPPVKVAGVYSQLSAPIGLPRWRVPHQNQESQQERQEQSDTSECSRIHDKAKSSAGSMADTIRINSGFNTPLNSVRSMSREEKLKLLQKRLMELPLEAFTDVKIQRMYRLVMHKSRANQIKRLPY